jgi:hypothetical protein
MSLQGFFVAGPWDDGDAVTGHYYETTSDDPGRAQIWGYSDRLSYAPGDEVALHMMGRGTARVVVARDGVVPEVVLDLSARVEFAATPGDCSVVGCGAAGSIPFQ